MPGVVINIYSKNDRILKILKEVSAHNDKEFAKAGFRAEYFEEKFGYSLAIIPFTMTAVMGFTIGKPIIMRGLRAEIKKIDPNIKIEERKKK
jgi:hypothetical protein